MLLPQSVIAVNNNDNNNNNNNDNNNDNNNNDNDNNNNNNNKANYEQPNFLLELRKACAIEVGHGRCAFLPVVSSTS